MKIQFYDATRRPWHRLHLQLSFGPVMWRCTNGRPNYQIEWSIHPEFKWKREDDYSSLPIWPTLEYVPWKEWTLALDENLGKVHQGSQIIIRWFTLKFNAYISRSINTKTQAEVDASCKRLGIR